MTETAWAIVAGFAGTLSQMAPYLLFGFAIAGILSAFISPEVVERHLGEGRRPLWGVVKATLFGIPLPLCSCGVIPVAASLRRHGASRGAATSFLISTPQTGVDSLFVTYSLLGPVFTVFRPLVALVSGVLGGGAVWLMGEDREPDSPPPPACHDECCNGTHDRSKFLQAVRYGFVTLPRDIGGAMLVGLLIAGLISALVPPHFFSQLTDPLSRGLGAAGASLAGMLVMMGVGIPIYVCATASVPIAAALMAKGVSGGAALVFLMTGPATNAATIAMIWKVMGRRTATIYLGTVAAMALVSGLTLDLLFPALRISVAEHMHSAEPGLLGAVSGIVLLGVLGAGALPKLLPWSTGTTTIPEGGSMPEDTPQEQVTIKIDGMTCSHCAGSVQRALSECDGVRAAEVDLGGKKAIVTGTADTARLIEAVRKLGYSASSG